MSKKISELTDASALSGSELVELVQGGGSKKTTAQAIANLKDAIDGSLTANRVPYATDSNTLADGAHWDNANTRLGIGAAPSHPLHITRNQNATTRAQITNTDTTNGSSRSEFKAVSGTVEGTITVIGTTTPGVFLGSGTSHDVMINTGGVTRVTVNTSGNVGVGSSPSYRLHAAQNQNATTTVAVTNTDTTNGSSTARFYAESGTAQAVVQAIGTTTPGVYIGSGSNHTVNLMANGSTKLSITPAGVLNIATAPTNDNTETSILVRQSDGEIQTRSASSLGVTDGDKGDITVGSSGTVWTINTDVLYAGTYTPSITNAVNLSASSVLENRFTNVFGHITVYGQISLQPTSSGTTVSFELSLPGLYPSNLATADDLTGMVVQENLTSRPAGTIIAHAGNDTALFTFVASGTSSTFITYSFNYPVQ